MNFPLQRTIPPLLTLILLTGCTNQTNNGMLQIASAAPANAPTTLAPHTAHSFPKIEVTFQLPDFKGDPYDFQANDIRAQLRLPGGQLLSLPAFFDGGTTWHVRHTPTAPGKYAIVALTRNGQKFSATAIPSTWNVAGSSSPGFIRIDPKNPRRFTFDSGARYYPLGMDQAWKTNDLPDIPVLFGKMGKAGLNWSRVWMNSWDGKNLDWPKTGDFGQLNLDVARRWDAIVQGAEQSGIYFQLVTQHHGQYSREVNPNWDDNPYNLKNGGFLGTPQEFFTDPRAKSLTKRKLRYMVARYGYSPNIMAWELWNEVQFTDAARGNQWDTVAAWHQEMSDFLRAQDPYHHLITTSSEAPPSVFASVDYYQRHAYPTNLITALSQPGFTGKEWPVKPEFTGEFGSDQTKDRPDEWTLHSGLWAGLMSDTAGAPQYWSWDTVEKSNLYSHFASVSQLLKASRFATHDSQSQLKAVPVTVTTPNRGPLLLSPGGDWGPSQQSDYDLVNPSDLAAFNKVPRFLQGQNHRDLNPKPITLKFSAPQAGSLRIRITQSARSGANLRVTVNGQTTEFPIPAADKDVSQGREFTVPLSAGAQLVSIENTGQDWVVLRDITVPGAAMLLDGYAKANYNFSFAWFYHVENIEAATPQSSSTGTTTLTGLQPGTYQITWCDTLTGQTLKTETARADTNGLPLNIPNISRDIALYAQKQ